MSHNYSILNLLNLKEENIFFEENFCAKENIKGVISNVFYGKLTYQPSCCNKCGHVFDNKIIKHGFKASLIKLPSVSGLDTYLKLKKQRFICGHCDSTFTLSTSIVNVNCQISNNSKHAIALNAKDKISEKDIAKNHNVSHSTVNRIIDSFYEYFKPNYSYLPEHLSFDEFKSVKSAAGAMSFVFCDSSNGKIVDIVEDRKLHSLTTYFIKYSKKARRAVKTIVIDMYSPYISLIKALFPNAKIIIDTFHIMQLFSRSLNKTRITLMNQDKKNYNKLKKYWRLLLMDQDKIDSTNSYYRRCFKKPMRQIDIINYLLELSPELKATYEFYHDLRYCIKSKNFKMLQTLLNGSIDNVSDYMKTSIKTIKKYLNYVKNTLTYSYNNGVIEGINNKIKVIKRIAFGFRSFLHFKNRILITQNLVTLKTA